MAIREGKLDLIDNKYHIKAELKQKISKMKKVKELTYSYQNGIAHNQNCLEILIKMLNIKMVRLQNNGQLNLRIKKMMSFNQKSKSYKILIQKMRSLKIKLKRLKNRKMKFQPNLKSFKSKKQRMKI